MTYDLKSLTMVGPQRPHTQKKDLGPYEIRKNQEKHTKTRARPIITANPKPPTQP